jgi:hypothetical protein
MHCLCVFYALIFLNFYLKLENDLKEFLIQIIIIISKITIKPQVPDMETQVGFLSVESHEDQVPFHN